MPADATMERLEEQIKCKHPAWAARLVIRGGASG
jgi:hypothetical protein